MIRSLGNRLAEDVVNHRCTTAVRQLPPGLYQRARRRLLCLREAEDVGDLRVPLGNRREALKGDRAGWFSIWINEKWRLAFRWEAGQALDVSTVDGH